MFLRNPGFNSMPRSGTLYIAIQLEFISKGSDNIYTVDIVIESPSQIRLLSFHTPDLYHCIAVWLSVAYALYFIHYLYIDFEENTPTGSGVWLGIKLSFPKWQGVDLPSWQWAIGRICWQMDTWLELAGWCRRQNAPSHRSVFLSSITAGKT